MTASPCRRCLLNESDAGDLYRGIHEYISAMPPEQRVSDGEYQARLSLCKQCDFLVNGICSMCGCFVEVRAYRRTARCAAGSRAAW